MDYHDTERGGWHMMIVGCSRSLFWIDFKRDCRGSRSCADVNGTIAMFDGFEPKRIAVYAPRCVEALLQDTRITRNRQKVAAAVRNAPVWMTVMEG